MAQTGDDYLYCIGIKMVNPDFVCFPKWADVVTTFEHSHTQNKSLDNRYYMYISKSLNVDK